jgi:hypothetical protein
MPAGRPPTYREDFVKQAFNLALLGATDEDLAAAFQVDPSTISRWKNEHPEFQEALKAGKEDANGRVAKSLYRRALGYKHKATKIFLHEGQPVTVDYIERYPPDTTAAIFWLKNRRSDLWRDKHEVDGTIKHSVGEEALQTLAELTAGPAARRRRKAEVGEDGEA